MSCKRAQLSLLKLPSAADIMKIKSRFIQKRFYKPFKTMHSMKKQYISPSVEVVGISGQNLLQSSAAGDDLQYIENSVPDDLNDYLF